MFKNKENWFWVLLIGYFILIIITALFARKFEIAEWQVLSAMYMFFWLDERKRTDKLREEMRSNDKINDNGNLGRVIGSTIEDLVNNRSRNNSKNKFHITHVEEDNKN